MRRQWQAIAQYRNRYANHLCPHRIASESIYLFLLFFTGHSCVVYGRHCNNNNSCDQWAEDKAIKPIASRTRDTMKHKRRNTKIESDEWMIANLWEIGTFENVPQTVPTGAKTSRETVRRFLFVDSICERNVTRFIEQSSCVCVRAIYAPSFASVFCFSHRQRRIRKVFWRLFFVRISFLSPKPSFRVWILSFRSSLFLLGFRWIVLPIYS